MEKENRYLCPYCKSDLRKVGVITTETEFVRYYWFWDDLNKGFIVQKKKREGTEFNEVLCGECESDITDFAFENLSL